MANSYADEFLTCVMKRSDNDVILRVGSVLLLMFAVPVIMVLIPLVILVIFAYMTDAYESGWESFEYILDNLSIGIMLFSSIIEAFITYMMINSYYMHQKRDTVWMGSLTKYAASYGKDVSELETINEQFSSNKADIIRKVAIVYFLFVLVSHTFMAILMSTKVVEGHMVYDIAYATSLSMLIEACLGSAYVFVSIRKQDNLQCDFTSKWASMMADEIPEAEPMVTRIKLRKIWPHLVLMAVTIGVYAIIFALWVIHTVNLHISRQNTYEEAVLKWIMDKEGAKGIQGVEDTTKHKFGFILRMIT